MTGEGIAAIILALATLVTSVGGVIIGLRNSRKIAEVHTLTNSMATRAEALAKKTGLAEGNLQGRAQQTAERDAERKDR